MIDENSHQIYFSKVHYIGAIVTYITHPKIHLDEKYQIVNLKPMIN